MNIYLVESDGEITLFPEKVPASKVQKIPLRSVLVNAIEHRIRFRMVCGCFTGSRMPPCCLSSNR